MSKKKVQRKKAPPKPKKHPQKAPKKNYFATMMETPEGRALRKEWSTRPRKKVNFWEEGKRWKMRLDARMSSFMTSANRLTPK